MTKLAVYAGEPNLVNEFAAWLGAPVPVAEYFITPGQTPLDQWRGVARQLVVCPQILQWGQGTLKQGADGWFNATWVTLAQNLISIGHSNAIIRLGWEFNANWMPWRAAADPVSFKKYFRTIVNAMRTVGTGFKFDWCVWINKAELADPTTVYPGNGYVDYIGIDVYDTVPGVTGWKSRANGTQGLDYWASFAASHGKKVSIPEWGLCPSGGDDVLFIEKMQRWIKTHDVAYHSYFNTDASGYGIGDHRISPNSTFPAPTPYPNAAARYKQLFGQ